MSILRQIFGKNRQATHPLAGRAENSISDRGNNRWNGRFAHAERLGQITRYDMHGDFRSVSHACDFIIGKSALLGGASAKSDLAFQRRGNAPDDSAFHLLLDTNRVNNEAAINGGNNAFHADVAFLIDSHIGHIRDVSMTEVSVASHPAAATFWNGPGPSRTYHEQFQERVANAGDQSWWIRP